MEWFLVGGPRGWSLRAVDRRRGLFSPQGQPRPQRRCAQPGCHIFLLQVGDDLVGGYQLAAALFHQGQGGAAFDLVQVVRGVAHQAHLKAAMLG